MNLIINPFFGFIKILIDNSKFRRTKIFFEILIEDWIFALKKKRGFDQKSHLSSRQKKRVNLWSYQQVWNKPKIFEKTLNQSSFASLTHKHPFGTSKIQLQKDFSQSKEGLWQLKVDEGRKNLRAKLKPPLSTANFSEYLLTSGKWWVNKTTGERLISSQAWKQYLQRYLQICAAFQIWRVYSPRNAQTDYAYSFQYLSSKIK